MASTAAPGQPAEPPVLHDLAATRDERRTSGKAARKRAPRGSLGTWTEKHRGHDPLETILAQTEIRSGYPLDATRTLHASWERLNLAAAMSATVRVNHTGSVTVLSTDGQPKVVKA